MNSEKIDYFERDRRGETEMIFETAVKWKE